MSRIGFYLLFLMLWGQTACDKGVDPDDNEGLKKIFSGNVLNIDLDYPYLYVAGGSEGLWRIDVSQDDFAVEYLALLDSAQDVYKVFDVDAQGSDIIAATGGEWPRTGIWRSEDRGHTWRRSEGGIDVTYGTEVISRSPHNPDFILTHTPKGQLYWSDNNGQSWHLFDTGINNSIIYFIIWNPYQAGEAWIHGDTNLDFPILYCVEDYGRSVKLKVDLDQFSDSELLGVMDIAFEPNDGTTIYLGTSITPYPIKSMDGGYTWQVIPSDSIWIRGFVVNDQQPGLFYVADFRNIYLSEDTLKTFAWIAKIPDAAEDSIYQILHSADRQWLFILTFSEIYLLALAD